MSTPAEVKNIAISDQLLADMRSTRRQRDRYVWRSFARLLCKAAVLAIVAPLALTPFAPRLMHDWLQTAGVTDPAQRVNELWSLGTTVALLVGIAMLIWAVIRLAGNGMSRTDRLAWQVAHLTRRVNCLDSGVGPAGQLAAQDASPTVEEAHS